MTNRALLGATVLIVSAAAHLLAQLPTIPEQLVRRGSSIISETHLPSGLPPTLDEVLRATDVILTGTVGSSESYLTKDQMSVQTDYELIEPVVLYHALTQSPLPTPAPSTTKVTIEGGAVTIKGLTYTSVIRGLPRLEAGTAGLFLLTRIDDKNVVALSFYGAFRKTAAGLIPWNTRQDRFGAELQGRTTDSTISAIVARKLELLRGQ